MTEAKGLGWKGEIKDQRDFKYSTPNSIKKDVVLPTKVDLRHHCPHVTDQGQLGSCTGHASAGMTQFLFIKQGDRRYTSAPLFIYYCTRELEGTVESDAGASIRDTMKAINKWGVTDETDWPYVITKFRDKPNNHAYTVAEQHQSITYEKVPQDLNEMMYLLNSGFPFIFGTTVYESFQRVGHDGMVTLPANNEQALGGHALCCVGYDLTKHVFIIRNSWGTHWGDKGYCYFPFSYLLSTDLTGDMWTIRLMESTKK